MLQVPTQIVNLTEKFYRHARHLGEDWNVASNWSCDWRCSGRSHLWTPRGCGIWNSEQQEKTLIPSGAEYHTQSGSKLLVLKAGCKLFTNDATEEVLFIDARDPKHFRQKWLNVGSTFFECGIFKKQNNPVKLRVSESSSNPYRWQSPRAEERKKYTNMDLRAPAKRRVHFTCWILTWWCTCGYNSAVHAADVHLSGSSCSLVVNMLLCNWTTSTVQQMAKRGLHWNVTFRATLASPQPSKLWSRKAMAHQTTQKKGIWGSSRGSNRVNNLMYTTLAVSWTWFLLFHRSGTFQ